MAKPKADSLAVAVLLTALTGFGPVSTDLYLPSLPSMVGEFKTTTAMVQLTLSAFLVGFAIMQLVYGPLSDRFGRRPLVIAGVVIYLLATVLCYFAPTIEALVIGRFLQAVGGCCGPVLGRAIVRDVYGREKSAKILSYMASAMALAPAIAPMIGGVLHVNFGWQANFLALGAFGVLVLLGSIFMLSETNANIDPGALKFSQLAKNFGHLISNRIYIGYVLTLGFSFSALFCFISGSSFVIIDVLKVRPDYFGFCFAIVVVGYMIGTFISGRLGMRLGSERMIMTGVLIGLLGGLLITSFAFMEVNNLASVIGPVALVFMACGFVLPNGMAGAIGPFPQMAGAASSLLGFLQMSIGAAIGSAVGHTHNGTVKPMALAILLMASLAAICYFALVRPVKSE